MATNISLKSILEGDNMLNGTNFLDWEVNLRIVLKHQKILYVIEKPLTEEPPIEDDTTAWEVWRKHKDDAEQVQCIMLAAMVPELRKQHKDLDAYEIMLRLRTLYSERARHERYEISRKLFRCRMSEGTLVENHVVKMIGYIERLAQLNLKMDNELSIDLILQSLPESYSHFIMNFTMMNMEKNLPELLSMLREVEPEINKGKTPILVIEGRKGKKKKAQAQPSMKPKGGVKKAKAIAFTSTQKPPKGICFHCGETGHWKRNCNKYPYLFGVMP